MAKDLLKIGLALELRFLFSLEFHRSHQFLKALVELDSYCRTSIYLNAYDDAPKKRFILRDGVV